MTELTAESFHSTFGNKMTDITQNAESTVDIWNYVEQLAEERIVSKYVSEEVFVEKVYRNDTSTFDHVLLPTENSNVFLIIIVDLINENVMGHYWIDMEKEYGLNEP